MREIKFRAWDGEKMYPLGFYKWQILADNDLMWGQPHEWKFMQYTGLRDKNGKEIYEGDILESTYKGSRGTFKHRCEVKVNDCYLGNGEYDDETIVGGWIVETKTFHPIESFEIIGNIYENKELLS